MNRFPIDFDDLVPGYVIYPEVIEGWARAISDDGILPERHHRDYRLITMKFRALLEREMASRGMDFVVIEERDSLRILEHNEAGPYLDKSSGRRARGLLRDQRKRQAVDRGVLTVLEQKLLDNGLKFWSGIESAIRTVGTTIIGKTASRKKIDSFKKELPGGDSPIDTPG